MKIKSISLFFAVTALFFGFGIFTATEIAHAAVPIVSNAHVSGSNTVTVTYSEPVNTVVADYSNFTGALSGRTLTGLTGSGNNTITLTFDGSSFSADSSGGLDIGANVASVSDGSRFSQSTVNVYDGTPPAIISLNISSNNSNNTYINSGNVISISFSANETLSNPTVTVSGVQLAVNGSGAGTYSASYTITGSETVPIPVVLNLFDVARNSERLSLTLENRTTVNNPVIISNMTRVSTDAVSNPSYSFTSSNSGSITFYGFCSSQTRTVVAGLNTIILDPLVNGSYNNCYLSVTDSFGNVSNMAQFAPFSVNSSSVSVTGALPTGCTSTAGFSTATGVPCNTVMVASPAVPATLPNGCTANYGFSTVTGASCGNGVSPSTSSTSNTPSAPSPSLTVVFLRPLSVGSSGPDVLALQQHLKNLGLLSAPFSGYYGNLTKEAVKKYQAKNGLMQLGNVGPATRALLNSGV